MTIPEYVKIRGRRIKVKVSGRGYIQIGKTTVSMDDQKKDELVNDPENWQKEMYRLFEEAVSAERKNK